LPTQAHGPCLPLTPAACSKRQPCSHLLVLAAGVGRRAVWVGTRAGHLAVTLTCSNSCQSVFITGINMRSPSSPAKRATAGAAAAAGPARARGAAPLEPGQHGREPRHKGAALGRAQRRVAPALVLQGVQVTAVVSRRLSGHVLQLRMLRTAGRARQHQTVVQHQSTPQRLRRPGALQAALTAKCSSPIGLCR